MCVFGGGKVFGWRVRVVQSREISIAKVPKLASVRYGAEKTYCFFTWGGNGKNIESGKISDTLKPN